MLFLLNFAEYHFCVFCFKLLLSNTARILERVKPNYINWAGNYRISNLIINNYVFITFQRITSH